MIIITNPVAFIVFQETTITEIKQKIMKIPDANGIVIDGFPRDVGQALSFEDQVSFFKKTSVFSLFAQITHMWVSVHKKKICSKLTL